ncbi:MAG: hypothetical protein ACLVKO_01475 [Dysgonomonas sp.]
MNGMEEYRSRRSRAALVFSGLCILFALLFYGCTAEDDYGFDINENGHPQPPVEEIPNDYFIVNFSTGRITGDDMTKSVSGPDDRITHLKYIIYNAVTGDFVKEKIVFSAEDGIQNWPLQQIQDTLPKGSYKAVFLGNVEKTLFPYALPSSPTNYSEVLSDYKSNYSNARIQLPNAPFSRTTEYYWANVEFSDQTPMPSVLLKRIINGARVKRDFVTAEAALDKLVENILTKGNYKNEIGAQVSIKLPGLLESSLGLLAELGLVGRVVNSLVDVLVKPVTDALYNMLLKRVTEEIGMALVGNSEKEQLLPYLGSLLNPWNKGSCDYAIVEVEDFPKSVDFDLNTREVFTGSNRFKYEFPNKGVDDEKYVVINTFNKPYKINNINAATSGLVSGLLVGGVIDEWLLPGIFVDVKEPLVIDQTNLNRRYKSDYSFADLNLKDHEGKGSINLKLRVGDVGNIEKVINGALSNILFGLLGYLLKPVTNIVMNIEVDVNLYLPGISETNLELTGSWSPIESY